MLSVIWEVQNTVAGIAWFLLLMRALPAGDLKIFPLSWLIMSSMGLNCSDLPHKGNFLDCLHGDTHRAWARTLLIICNCDQWLKSIFISNFFLSQNVSRSCLFPVQSRQVQVSWRFSKVLNQYHIDKCKQSMCQTQQPCG